MAIKCITGVVVPNFPFQSIGEVTINLSDGSIEPTNQASFAEVTMFGGSELFRSRPCVNISLRELKFLDQDSGSLINADNPIYFDLDDNFLNGHSQLKVSWECSPTGIDFSLAKEISVMVIGET